jgi:hypothetical protein
VPKNDERRQHSKRFDSCIDCSLSILAREREIDAGERGPPLTILRRRLAFLFHSLLEQHFLAPHAPNGNSENLSPPMVTVAK